MDTKRKKCECGEPDGCDECTCFECGELLKSHEEQTCDKCLDIHDLNYSRVLR